MKASLVFGAALAAFVIAAPVSSQALPASPISKSVQQGRSTQSTPCTGEMASLPLAPRLAALPRLSWISLTATMAIGTVVRPSFSGSVAGGTMGGATTDGAGNRQ